MVQENSSDKNTLGARACERLCKRTINGWPAVMPNPLPLDQKMNEILKENGLIKEERKNRNIDSLITSPQVLTFEQLERRKQTTRKGDWTIEFLPGSIEGLLDYEEQEETSQVNSKED